VWENSSNSILEFSSDLGSFADCLTPSNQMDIKRTYKIFKVDNTVRPATLEEFSVGFPSKSFLSRVAAETALLEDHFTWVSSGPFVILELLELVD
jgi:hypothetical protein